MGRTHHQSFSCAEEASPGTQVDPGSQTGCGSVITSGSNISQRLATKGSEFTATGPSGRTFSHFIMTAMTHYWPLTGYGGTFRNDWILFENL
jgi:hypothetical protein